MCHHQGIGAQVVEEVTVGRHLLDAHDLGQHLCESLLHVLGDERFGRLSSSSCLEGRGRPRIGRCFLDGGLTPWPVAACCVSVCAGHELQF
ncbi:hypothetical protein SY2F82_33410 [Streptomyces sp. Y2F8-2]|nr:hypothetical protein SY2F82_33410 [Streptomyces sp. Y2F8-2]